ncbi:hypothetical protein MBLNU230_g8112t1 [Neophaeotheca triangularis]
MPHATSSPPAAERSPRDGEDTVLPEAPTNESDSQAAQDETMQDAPAENLTQIETRLEDMFDDDDDEDDEFSSSAPTRAADSSQAELPANPKPKYSDPDNLKQFYQRLFPFRPLFQWLNHGAAPQPDFQNREFAFVLPNDAYLRYQAFPSADVFRKQAINLTPTRFEIGPQYTLNPKDRKSIRKASAFRPIMKELVFDIDLTDYDPIRTCCTGANICRKCWQFMVMAIKVVDTALREDFDFQHILWVYSGRRGAHAWISDKKAREMDDQKRKAVAGYLTLIQGSDHGKRTSIRRPLHPHIDRSLKVLNPYFQSDILEEQDPWRTAEQAEKLLALLPDPKLTKALQKKWDSAPNRSSVQKWADIDAVAEAGELTAGAGRQLMEAKQDIRLEYTYPRLDAEVSKKLNHLLKSPFVIHPGTGRVCVPIDVRSLEDFDPFDVPTVTQLLQEIDDWDKEHTSMPNEQRAQVADWQKTSIKPYIEYFRGHVSSLLKEESTSNKRNRDAAASADTMEF